MGVLEELKGRWTLRDTYESEVQRRMWDRRAEDFKEHPLPEMDKDPFLVRMAETIDLDKNCSALDVGCGAGGYSMTLAGIVDRAEGVDISPNMIRAASDRAKSLGLENCSFSVVDWAEADIDALGFRQAFDVAFAHMTPAVCDYTTLEKLDECARTLCMLEKPTRRTNMIQDACFAAIGLGGEASLDTDLINIFTYAWAKGYQPKLYYRKETWNIPQKAEAFAAWCADRARQKKPLSAEDERTIREFILSRANAEGMIEELTETTRVTVIWDKRS